MIKKRAMSLAEILVATFIAALMLTVVVSIYYYSSKATVSGMEKAAAQQSFNTTIDCLARDLRSTGSNVSTDICGIPKENSVGRIRHTFMALYGDFDSNSNTVEKVEYLILNDNCLIRRLYQQQGTKASATWVNPTDKILIGNTSGTGSKVQLGAIRFLFYDAAGEELTVDESYKAEEIFMGFNNDYIIGPACASFSFNTPTVPPPTITPGPSPTPRPPNTPRPPTPTPNPLTPKPPTATPKPTSTPKPTATLVPAPNAELLVRSISASITITNLKKVTIMSQNSSNVALRNLYLAGEN